MSRSHRAWRDPVIWLSLISTLCVVVGTTQTVLTFQSASDERKFEQKLDVCERLVQRREQYVNQSRFLWTKPGDLQTNLTPSDLRKLSLVHGELIAQVQLVGMMFPNLSEKVQKAEIALFNSLDSTLKSHILFADDPDRRAMINTTKNLSDACAIDVVQRSLKTR